VLVHEDVLVEEVPVHEVAALGARLAQLADPPLELGVEPVERRVLGDGRAPPAHRVRGVVDEAGQQPAPPRRRRGVSAVRVPLGGCARWRGNGPQRGEQLHDGGSGDVGVGRIDALEEAPVVAHRDGVRPAERVAHLEHLGDREVRARPRVRPLVHVEPLAQLREPSHELLPVYAVAERAGPEAARERLPVGDRGAVVRAQEGCRLVGADRPGHALHDGHSLI
jgi:hypothetical protein